jgi:hypothetical protein
MCEDALMGVRSTFITCALQLWYGLLLMQNTYLLSHRAVIMQHKQSIHTFYVPLSNLCNSALGAV